MDLVSRQGKLYHYRGREMGFAVTCPWNPKRICTHLFAHIPRASTISFELQ